VGAPLGQRVLVVEVGAGIVGMLGQRLARPVRQGRIVGRVARIGVEISPVAIALKVQAAKTGGPEDRAAYLEELIVRRELAMNWPKCR
jgi:hypothetical protein